MVYSQNDEVQDTLKSFDWEKMPIKARKLVPFMIQMSQNSRSLTMGGLIPLSMETFLSVIIQ